MTNHTNLAVNIETSSQLTFNLRKLMHQKNISEAELARQTNIPQPTLHKILSGKTGDPRASTLKSLAEFFDITIDGLLSGEMFTGLSGSLNNTRSVAIISWAECLQAKSILRTLNSANWEHWITTECASSNAFALTSKPSMEPRFPRASVLIIDPDIAPEDGDMVVAWFPGTEEATLREILIDGPIRSLQSVGPQPGLITPLNSEIAVLGVLVKSVFTFHS